MRCGPPLRVLVRGSGDVGPAVAHRLFVSGFAMVIHESLLPTATRRGMSFTDAIFDGHNQLEGAAHCRGRSERDRSSGQGVTTIRVHLARRVMGARLSSRSLPATGAEVVGLDLTASEVDEIDFGPAGDSATELTDG